MKTAGHYRGLFSPQSQGYVRRPATWLVCTPTRQTSTRSPTRRLRRKILSKGTLSKGHPLGRFEDLLRRPRAVEHPRLIRTDKRGYCWAPRRVSDGRQGLLILGRPDQENMQRTKGASRASYSTRQFRTRSPTDATGATPSCGCLPSQRVPGTPRPLDYAAPQACRSSLADWQAGRPFASEGRNRHPASGSSSSDWRNSCSAPDSSPSHKTHSVGNLSFFRAATWYVVAAISLLLLI